MCATASLRAGCCCCWLLLLLPGAEIERWPCKQHGAFQEGCALNEPPCAPGPAASSTARLNRCVRPALPDPTRTRPPPRGLGSVAPTPPSTGEALPRAHARAPPQASTASTSLHKPPTPPKPPAPPTPPPRRAPRLLSVDVEQLGLAAASASAAKRVGGLQRRRRRLGRCPAHLGVRVGGWRCGELEGGAVSCRAGALAPGLRARAGSQALTSLLGPT